MQDTEREFKTLKDYIAYRTSNTFKVGWLEDKSGIPANTLNKWYREGKIARLDLLIDGLLFRELSIIVRKMDK